MSSSALLREFSGFKATPPPLNLDILSNFWDLYKEHSYPNPRKALLKR
jgi:hypothetical protein